MEERKTKSGGDASGTNKASTGTAVKICGLSRPEDIFSVNEYKPEYMGFVFWSKSRRAVSRSQATDLKKLLHPEIQAVGVFVNEDVRQIISLLESNIIDMAQLHGDETEDDIRRIQDCTGRPVIKAVKMKQPEDMLPWQGTRADYLLLDSGMGTGKTFDWSLIQKIEKPFFLAGGLGADNVRTAIEAVRPYAVDVSSGVETAGKKDREKIHTIIRRVRDEQR